MFTRASVHCAESIVAISRVRTQLPRVFVFQITFCRAVFLQQKRQNRIDLFFFCHFLLLLPGKRIFSVFAGDFPGNISHFPICRKTMRFLCLSYHIFREKAKISAGAGSCRKSCFLLWSISLGYDKMEQDDKRYGNFRGE